MSELVNASSFLSLHTLITLLRLHAQREKHVAYRSFCLIDCLFVREGERRAVYASVITAVKEK
jgi:hypothetical protein